MDSKIEKREFQRIREQIQEEGIANVTVYHRNSFADPSVEAYAVLTDRPPTIQLLKGKYISYKQLLIDMLHEVGHIIDYTMHKDTKRVKSALNHNYNQDTVKNTLKLTKYIKFTILQWEIIANNYIEVLLKKYSVKQGIITKRDLKCNAAFDFYAVLNELVTGRLTTSKQRAVLTSWLESKKSIPEITPEFIRKSLIKPYFPKNFNKTS